MYNLFPFEKIEKNAAIILYGIGAAGRDYLDQMSKSGYCRIIAVLDRDYEKTPCYRSYDVWPPEAIRKIQGYDYVLVSVQEQSAAEKIKESLLTLGVPANKILHCEKRYTEADKGVSLPLFDLFEKYPIGGRDNDIYREYVNYCEDLNLLLRQRHRNKYFVDITDTPYLRHEDDPKLVAWYLPQYYKMAVNDEHHGMGFTEWTSTTRTIPLFTGHYQPRLPYDMGFYNLTDIEVLKRQVELAKMYGIYGFAFHYYWFSGVKTMEKPLELFLEHKELDIKFCMHWCTENWTAIWDGQDQHLIYEQTLHDDDDEKFMADIIPYMKDDRYIKIDGKPVLQIYRVALFEQERFLRLLGNFRKYAQKAGFPDLYIMLSNRDGLSLEPASWGADAIVESIVHSIRTCGRHEEKGYFNRYFQRKNMLRDVESFIAQGCTYPDEAPKNMYRTALVGFDSSPRKASSQGCVITVDSTPANFKKWLKIVINEAKMRRCEERYAFIFAWNEWAESAYLEPDLLYGYAYLQAVSEAVTESRPVRKLQEE
jgi:hypothetical protein